jgi:hypothetical protein
LNRRIFVLERKLPQLIVELFTRHLTHQGRKFVIQNRVRIITVILGHYTLFFPFCQVEKGRMKVDSKFFLCYNSTIRRKKERDYDSE